jgi:hypothetical protein
MGDNKYLLELTLYIIILLLVIFIFYYINTIYYKRKDYFDNMEDNLYSYDTCCTQDQMNNCMKYGKTGVCDYNKNNKSCMCQNSF